MSGGSIPVPHRPADRLGPPVDDGAVVYLNGVEVQRVNMADGPIAYDTRPSSWAAGPDERMKEYPITPDALVAGINTMAVEVHNLWPGTAI